jgi:large subunit ribosomal protein L13
LKTFTPKPSDIEQKWYVIDANGQVLGRLATRIADILRGKNKPIWAPHMDCGDFVVVINADKVLLTGRKMTDKRYVHYTGYPGGLRHTPISRVMEKKPEFVLRHAVRGMMPHNKLGRHMLRKLKIYTTPEHPHAAQQPETLTL